MVISRFKELIRQGCVDLHLACPHGGKGSTPPAPDYAGAATATAQGNLEATRAATEANRINQYTPYGSLTYSRDPNAATPDSGWSQNINLNDTGQKLLDYANQSALGLGQQTGQALGRVNESLSKPFDYSSVGDVQNAAQGAITSRLDPMWQQREQQTNTQLINQGLRPGTEAYTNAMRDFNSGRNDAYQQAILAGINTMPQTYQMAQALRSQPLNELNALRTGSQVTNPTFNQVPQQQTTAGANMLGAAQAQGQAGLDAYNTQVGGQNSFMSGLMGLGGAAMMSPAGTFAFMSDIRLKSNIERVGTHPLGIGIYEYDIFDRRERGVMAQELFHVKPDAVHVHDSGYLMVDYGKIGNVREVL